MALIYLRDSYVDVEALIDFFFALVGCKDDAHGKYVVYLFERHMFILHLRPDGVGGFYALLNLVFDAHFIQCSLNRFRKLVEQFVALHLGVFQFLLDAGILLRMFVLEREVLQLRLHLVESQTISQRGVDVQRLTGNLVLFVGRLRFQRAHIVQTVANLDEDDADVLTHCQ